MPSDFPTSRWWDFPTRPSAKAATAFVRPSATPASSSRTIASPSISRQRTCARPARRSTCRSRWGCWRLPVRSRDAPSTTRSIVGELSLDGAINGIRGVLPIAVAARRLGLKRLLLPPQNAAEASVVEGLDVCVARSLPEAVDALNQPDEARRARGVPPPAVAAPTAATRRRSRRRPRAAARAARAGSRGRRRSQPAADRTARRRQDDDGAGGWGRFCRR